MYVEEIARFTLAAQPHDDVEDVPFDATILALLEAEETDVAASAQRQAQSQLESLLTKAFDENNRCALLEFHKALFVIYDINFLNPLHSAVRHLYAPWLLALRRRMEEAWLDADLDTISADIPPEECTRSPERISAWFNSQAATRSYIDQCLEDFLQHKMQLDDLKLFVLTDGYLNFRFYDAVILSAQHYSDSVKQEIVRHIYDESGEGDIRHAHTNRFAGVLQTLNLQLPRVPVWTSWEPYAGFNLYFMLGLSRRLCFKALGSLAMPELFDPAWHRALNAGLRRLGFNAETDFSYYVIHEMLDSEHGASWLSHIVQPIVRHQPEAGWELAVGGALRLLASRRYNTYLAQRFGLL